MATFKRILKVVRRAERCPSVLKNWQTKQDRWRTYNVTLSSVRAAIVAVEKQ
jgi:hypothetical protein